MEIAMQTRRSIVFSGLAVMAAGSIARAGDDSDLPKATVVKGKPPYLDFGDGVKVPCTKGAFLTLWEGPGYWLTFGFGSAGIADVAQSRAVYHAEGAMRYLLLTLAFAPDRLQLAEGHGWRQKEEKPENYVMGDLALPGRPSRALDDVFLGRGSADAKFFWGQPDAGGMAAMAPTGPGGPAIGNSGMVPSMTAMSVNAFCCYVVLKKDLSLADVRQRAKILKI
jgi:hypothetical protein